MIINGLVVAAFVLSLIFPLSYMRSRWSMYPPGRALMFFSVIVALVLGMSTWRVLTGNSVPQWLRVGAFIGIIVSLAYMDLVLLREQSQDRKRTRLVSAGHPLEERL